MISMTLILNLALRT